MQRVYKNGDLVFWISVNNFVIFIDCEENSVDINKLIKLGKVTE